MTASSSVCITLLSPDVRPALLPSQEYLTAWRPYSTFLGAMLTSGAPLGSYLVRRSSRSASESPSWRMMSSRARHVPVRVRLRFELASVSLQCRQAVSISSLS